MGGGGPTPAVDSIGIDFIVGDAIGIDAIVVDSVIIGSIVIGSDPSRKDQRRKAAIWSLIHSSNSCRSTGGNWHKSGRNRTASFV